jgi:CheY-specific phosphatase CheX
MEKDDGMNDIASLDLMGIVSRAIDEVSRTMLSMEVTIKEGESEEISEKERIVGTVSLAGGLSGSCHLHLPHSFAASMAGAMMDTDPDELETEEVEDAVGEICNMIGGALKSELNNKGFSCALSIPSITAGSDFHIQSKGWQRKQRLSFHYEQNLALVEVFLKPGA